MSEQTVSKSVHKIPQRIIEEIEKKFSEPFLIPEFENPVFQKVDKVEFIRTYQNKEGTWEVFEVNGIVLISVLDAVCWTWDTVERDEAQKKAFGKRVRYIMEKSDVPWELAKMAVRMNPVNFYHPEHIANAEALNFIIDVKAVLGTYHIFCEGRMSIEEYLKRHARYHCGYLTDKQVRVIKKYWLSMDA